MAPLSNQEDNIERYLREEMDHQERKVFEEALNEDESLQEEVDLQQDVFSGIGLFGAEEMKKQLQAIDADEKDSSPIAASRGRPLYTWLAVAASVTALLLVAIFLFNAGPNSQELYATYYEPYPNVVNPVERSSGVPTDAAGKAMYFYEQGNFEEAIKLFTQEPNLNDLAYRFYLGVSYLGTQQSELAEQTLQPLLEDEEGAFYEAALWYTSLSQLARDQSESAREILEKIADLQGEYAREAQELLEEI